MKKYVTSKAAVREFVRDSMGIDAGESNVGQQRTAWEPKVGDAPVTPNSTIRPEDVAPPVEPLLDDPEYQPANSLELAAAASAVAREVPPQLLSAFYAELLKLRERTMTGQLEQTQQQTTAAVEEKVIEAHDKIRGLVRDLVNEAPRGTKKNTVVTDVDGVTFDQIAKEFGFAAPIGAKGFIERTSEKFAYLYKLVEDNPGLFDKLVLLGTGKYIDTLYDTGLIDEEDKDLMYDNPALVLELPTFRVFMHKYIKKMMREEKKQEKEARDEQ